MHRVAALLPATLLGFQLVMEFVLVAMITSEFGAPQAAIYFTTIAQIAVWNLVFTSGFHDFLTVTKLTGAKRYLRLSIIALMAVIPIALTVVEFQYLLGLVLSTVAVLFAKWATALIRLSNRVFVAISIDAATAIVIKACLILTLTCVSGDALNLLMFAYFATVLPQLFAAIVGLVYCRANRIVPAPYPQGHAYSNSMIAKLYLLKMAGQLYRKADVLIINAFFPSTAVTAYAIIKQLISASYKISGKIFAQVAIIQAKLSENDKPASKKIIKTNFYMSAVSMAFAATAIYLGLLLVQLPKVDLIAEIAHKNSLLYLAVFVNFLILTRANLFAQALKAWGMAGSILLYSVVLSVIQLSSLALSSLVFENIVAAVWINTIVCALYFLPIMRNLYKKNAK
jgi:hypothetical protein